MTGKKTMLIMAALCVFTAFCAGFPKPALARQPTLVLEDKERGTSVTLYKNTDPSGDRYRIYVNEKYSYSAWIPSDITEVILLPDNEDGLILASKDGSKRFRASGGLAEFVEGGLVGAFIEAYKANEANLLNVVFIQNDMHTEWRISWREKDTIRHRKFTIKDGNWFDCEISHAASESESYGYVVDSVLLNSGPPEG